MPIDVYRTAPSYTFQCGRGHEHHPNNEDSFCLIPPCQGLAEADIRDFRNAKRALSAIRRHYIDHLFSKPAHE